MTQNLNETEASSLQQRNKMAQKKRREGEEEADESEAEDEKQEDEEGERETSTKQTTPKRQYMSFLSVVSSFFPLNKYVVLILYG